MLLRIKNIGMLFRKEVYPPRRIELTLVSLCRGPNDEKANEMLDIFHHFMTLLFDGKLYTAPIKDDIENALDICTGTGK